MVYEGIVLFGVLFAAEMVFALATQQVTGDAKHTFQNLFLFVVLAVYFTYFWGHGGQTLPMQTWRIRVTTLDRQPIRLRQAALRYCAAWMWFLPALAISHFLAIQSIGQIFALVAAGMAAWALTSKFDPNGQFLHDRLAGTCLISVPKKTKSGVSGDD